MNTSTSGKIDVVRNGLNVTKLIGIVDLVKNSPSLGFFQLRANNKWDTNLHNQATIDSFYGAGQEMRHKQPHVVHSDEPAVLLGDDTAPNPGENALAALSSCMTSTLIYKAGAMGIDLESVASEFEGDVDLQGFLGLDPDCRNGFKEIRVTFKVRADADAKTIEELVKTSPVYDSFTNPVPIKVSVEMV